MQPDEAFRLEQWFLTGETRPPGGRQEISSGAQALTCSTVWKLLNGNVFLPNVAPVLILRRYMLFGLVPVRDGCWGYVS